MTSTGKAYIGIIITQVVSGYKAYTSGNKSELKTKVSSLHSAGATAADYAMDLTKTLVDQSKTDANNNADRKNVKRVVIFLQMESRITSLV